VGPDHAALRLILCVVPIPYFWKLQLPVRQKMMASCLFFLGGFACVASIVRLTFLHLLNGDYIDVTYNVTSSLLWTLAECTIGIICVSLPSLRPLLSKMVPGLRTSKSGNASRPQATASKASSMPVAEGSQDEIELCGQRRESWSVLPEPEARAGPIWDGRG